MYDLRVYKIYRLLLRLGTTRINNKVCLQYQNGIKFDKILGFKSLKYLHLKIFIKIK